MAYYCFFLEVAENNVKNFVEIFAKEITVEVAKKIGKLLTSSKRKLQITCILNKEAAEEINERRMNVAES